MIKIALTGGDGLVGSRIIELLKEEFDFINLPQKLMDITNKNQVYQILKDINFDFFLHLAAYTNVAGAEKEKEFCFKINVEGTKNLFEMVLSKRKKFIYISTDFVFDGKNPPFFEDSQPKPIGNYGLSKYQGEKIIDKEGMIIRISYPFRTRFEKKLDFFRKFKFLLEEKKTLTLIDDSLITPTFIDDIAYGLNYLVKNFSNEIFHLVGASSLSPYEAGLIIAKNFNLEKNLIKKITFKEYTKKTPGLPQWSQIKSKKNFFWPMKTFEEAIKIIRKNFL